jgi:hypothetical protein
MCKVISGGMSRSMSDNPRGTGKLEGIKGICEGTAAQQGAKVRLWVTWIDGTAQSNTISGTRLDCDCDTLNKQPIMRHRRNWTGQMRRTNECGRLYTVSLWIASVQPRRCEAHDNTDYTLMRWYCGPGLFRWSMLSSRRLL